MSITVSVDRSADAAYVMLSDREVRFTEEAAEDVLVDLDEFREVVGIELLELGAEIPFQVLIERFHVPSGAISAIRKLRASLEDSSLIEARDGSAPPVPYGNAETA